MAIDEWDKVVKFAQVELVTPGGAQPGQGLVLHVSGRGALMEFRDNFKGMLTFREVKRAKVELDSIHKGDLLKGVYLLAGGRRNELGLAPAECEPEQEQAWTGGEDYVVVRSIRQQSIRPLYVLLRGQMHPLSAFSQIVPAQ